MIIDAGNLNYRQLNAAIKRTHSGNDIELTNINGQRYICAGAKDRKVRIVGTPGNDLAAFSRDLDIEVIGNVQDGVANTLGSGTIIIHGCAGDVLGYSMTGGKVLVRDGTGYRAGIHMKEYLVSKPIIIIGGSAGDFLGEYMAGGIIVLLQLDKKPSGNFIGTGMHAGTIFVRGGLEDHQVGKGAVIVEPDREDTAILNILVGEFCSRFEIDYNHVMEENFHKLIPLSRRPYGKLYSTHC